MADRSPLYRIGPRRPRRPSDPSLLRRVGVEVDALVNVRGEPPTRWRGVVRRNVNGLVTLAVAGSDMEIEFTEGDAIEVTEWWTPDLASRRSIEATQRARLGRSSR